MKILQQDEVRSYAAFNCTKIALALWLLLQCFTVSPYTWSS